MGGGGDAGYGGDGGDGACVTAGGRAGGSSGSSGPVAAAAQAVAVAIGHLITSLIPIDPKGAQEEEVNDRQKVLTPDKRFHRTLDRGETAE